jgi:SAM-dependent methyltransferase
VNLRSLWSRLRQRHASAPPSVAAAGPYIYQPSRAPLSYDDAVELLAARGLEVRRGQVDDLDEAQLDRVIESLRAQGIGVRDFDVDAQEFQRYVDSAGYLGRYESYYSDNRPEKMLEHFIAYRMLGLSAADRVIDLASEHSPVPEIYSRLSGARCYAQDIQYPAGVHGDRIGGDACAMPIEAGFASAATLTCSLEHFEGDGDTRLVAEVARVLRPGGRLVVAPLYMAEHEVTQTDPLCSAATDVTFDAGCVVCCKPGWGNRHGRYYSPRSLLRRLVEPNRPMLDFTVYRLRNRGELPAGIYLRLFMVCERR